MTFGSVAFLWLGAGLVGGVVALHLLARRLPRARNLPTVRFVPERAVSAPAPRVPPSDLWLLVLRAAAVALFAVAFARPEIDTRSGVRRLILMDRSASVASIDEAADSVARLAQPRDVILAFDTAISEVGDPRVVGGSSARGSLTAGLIAAVRAARAAAAGADSLELIVVSAFAREEWDSATTIARAAWRGRARAVRLRAAAPPLDEVDAAMTPDDPLAAALALGTPRRFGATVRVVRGSPEPADSAWAHDTGGALVAWPASFDTTTDTVGGVIAADAVVVSEFERPSREADLAGDGRRPMAWWIDGAVAATERTVGRGCIRDVGIPVPSASDLALRPSFVAFVRDLTAPCGGPRDTEPLADSIVLAFGGAGPSLAGRLVAAPLPPRVPANPWLLAAALGLLLIEPLVRRRRSA